MDELQHAPEADPEEECAGDCEQRRPELVPARARKDVAQQTRRLGIEPVMVDELPCAGDPGLTVQLELKPGMKATAVIKASDVMVGV